LPSAHWDLKPASCSFFFFFFFEKTAGPLPNHKLQFCLVETDPFFQFLSEMEQGKRGKLSEF